MLPCGFTKHRVIDQSLHSDPKDSAKAVKEEPKSPKPGATELPTVTPATSAALVDIRMPC